jgi:hypothetical protein
MLSLDFMSLLRAFCLRVCLHERDLSIYKREKSGAGVGIFGQKKKR